MSDLFSKMEIINAIRVFLESKGYILRPNYDRVFEPARVPVFGSKSVGKNVEEVFVDIITEPTIKADSYIRDRVFQRSMSSEGLTLPNASSAGFFRHYFPEALVYWAIPEYVEKNEAFNIFLAKCKEGDIGLLEVRKKNKEEFEVIEFSNSARSLLQERLVTLQTNLSKGQSKKMENLLKKWSQEDLSYLVFYPEPKFQAADISIRDEEHSISRELINRMEELQNIAYRETLSKFSATYNSRFEGDYVIALEVTEQLWKRYGLDFPKLHRDFEEVLKLDPRYRDHFLHAFQVFLAGAYIIDKLYDQINKDGFGNKVGYKIEDAWLIAATYHDYDYMIQNFDDWTQNFFKAALHLRSSDKNPASLHLSESYVKDGYMFNTKILVDSLSIKVDNVVLDFLYNRILEKKNHGLLSGLSLLQYLDAKSNKLNQTVRKRACRAISIHDDDIWWHLSGLAPNDKQDKVGKKFKAKKFLEKIAFVDDPLSFLLILLDNVQDEGREPSDSQNWAELEFFYISDKDVFYGLQFDGNNSAEVYEKKGQALKKVKKFLNGNKKFTISITDRASGEQMVFPI